MNYLHFKQSRLCADMGGEVALRLAPELVSEEIARASGIRLGRIVLLATPDELSGARFKGSMLPP